MVPSVTAVVRDDGGRLLVIHKTDNDLWTLPGGGHDIGERIGDTVVSDTNKHEQQRSAPNLRGQSTGAQARSTDANGSL